jgi:hypothetical protein
MDAVGFTRLRIIRAKSN